MLVGLVAGKVVYDLYALSFGATLLIFTLSFFSGLALLAPAIAQLLGYHIATARKMGSGILFLSWGLVLGYLDKPDILPAGIHAFKATISENYGESKNKKIRCLANLEHVLVEEKWIAHSGKVLLMFEPDSGVFRNGTQILAAAPIQAFESPTIPGQFDSKQYYLTQGIYYQVFANKGAIKILPGENRDWVRGTAQEVRSGMERIILKYLPEEDAHMLSALLLGIRRKIDPELKAAYSAAGVTHVLAVSGMHVGLIFLVLTWTLGWIKHFKHGKRVFAVVVISLLWFYGYVTGLSPSVLRAVTIFSVLQLNEVLEKPPFPVNSLCLATILLMCVNPNIVYDVGYQLSFSAVYGIICFSEPIQNFWYTRNKALKLIWEATVVSIAATLGTFPVILYYFHQFPSYFLFSNLVAVPLSNGLIYGGIGLLAASWFPTLGEYIGYALSLGIKLLNSFVLWISQIPGSLIEDIYIGLPELSIILGALFCLQLFIKTNQIRWLNMSLAGLVLAASFHAFTNLVEWNRPEKILVMRTSKEWVFGKMKGRTAWLHRFGINKPEQISPFEAKAMREGFHCLDVKEDVLITRPLALHPTRPEAYSALFKSEGKSILILGNYLKQKQQAPKKLKVDYLILRTGGFKTLDNALLLFEPREIWVNWNVQQEKTWKEKYNHSNVPVRNFRVERFFFL